MSNRTTVETDQETKERLNKFCKKKGKIQYRVVTEALNEYLDKKEAQEKS